MFSTGGQVFSGVYVGTGHLAPGDRLTPRGGTSITIAALYWLLAAGRQPCNDADAVLQVLPVSGFVALRFVSHVCLLCLKHQPWNTLAVGRDYRSRVARWRRGYLTAGLRGARVWTLTLARIPGRPEPGGETVAGRVPPGSGRFATPRNTRAPRSETFDSTRI